MALTAPAGVLLELGLADFTSTHGDPFSFLYLYLIGTQRLSRNRRQGAGDLGHIYGSVLFASTHKEGNG
jgi:hypothetical protein